MSRSGNLVDPADAALEEAYRAARYRVLQPAAFTLRIGEHSPALAELLAEVVPEPLAEIPPGPLAEIPPEPLAEIPPGLLAEVVPEPLADRRAPAPALAPAPAATPATSSTPATPPAPSATPAPPTHCAFLTACNPGSTRLDDAENARRMRGLRADVEAMGHAFLEGVAIDPDGGWPDEPSLLVLGISLPQARALGARWQQNAIVVADRHAIPRLEWLN